eukprot:CAMPEP_0179065648 /NCGR_PEP_ID=MMETSP0796-20121207/28571_1 /TAXON_ID=73915 /ORGANISM="Pyrodinium bahamense, Strain pbaha01" /LENGTH=434 /DNA_ID=CAMNT_0020762631 /DNA_START=86 /DNA_END=1390 /DNA_ORIENTATION=+
MGENQPAMLRACFKNSFLVVEGPEDAVRRREASTRAHSAGPAPAASAEAEAAAALAEASLRRVNSVLCSCPRGVQEWLASQPRQVRPPQAHQLAEPQWHMQQPPSEPSLWHVPSAGASSWGGGRRPVTTAVACTTGVPCTEIQGVPSVDELRRLQRKLSEVTGTVAKLPSGKQLAQQRVLSNSSVSTMVSECEDPSVKSPMQKVWSSGSVSTMVSDHWEDYDEGGTEFGPIFEEEAPAVAGAQEPPPTSEQQRSAFVAAGSITRWDAEAAADQGRERVQLDFCHPGVPRNLNLAEEFLRNGNQAPPTTMMIRNIPNRYTQRELIKELNKLGFAGAYDFLYVPIDKGTLCNVGYGFVNFIDATWAARCVEVFEEYPFKKHRKARGKIASVSVAHIQGLEANVKHYQNSAVNGGMVPRSRQRGPVIIARIEKSLGC